MEINKQDRTITVAQNTGVTISIALLLAFIGAVFTLATVYSDYQYRLGAAERRLVSLSTDIVSLKSDGTDAKIKFTEIQTQLKSIDASLVEIKEKIR